MGYSDSIKRYDDRPLNQLKDILTWATTGENKEKMIFILCEHVFQLEKKVEEMEEKLNQLYADLYD